jgi:flagellar basal-body rod protein FlgC
MGMDLVKAIKVSASGMKAQGVRLRVISENLANANSLAETPGGDPYRRKLVSFKEVLDKSMGANTVAVNKVEFDQSEFGKRYDPTHPAADKDGYVSTPNVNSLIEMMDMREAQRSYSANLDMIDTSKRMIERTIDLLRE